MEDKSIRHHVIKSLADYLGVEPEDIKDDDTLSGDLHMRATDLTDYVETLQEIYNEAGNIDLTLLETVGDLIEALGGESYSDEENTD